MPTQVPNLNISTNKVQIELSSNTLKQLLNSGLLHGNDCNCLNTNAKKILWQALLATSINSEVKLESSLCA